jgi:hypothetical protein
MKKKNPFSIFHPLTFISNIYMLFINNNKQKLESHNYRVNYRVMVFNFQQHFSYILVVNFIGGGNQNTRRKPPTYRKCNNYNS